VRGDRPRLARHVRLTFDRTRRRHVLLLPETVVLLRGSGAAVLALCDGRRTVEEIETALRARFAAVPPGEVAAFLDGLAARRWVEAGDG
jgi:pyrroloquinoline quinone biosynthesis protein D